MLADARLSSCCVGYGTLGFLFDLETHLANACYGALTFLITPVIQRLVLLRDHLQLVTGIFSRLFMGSIHLSCASDLHS
jgi:hypothetical protein